MSRRRRELIAAKRAGCFGDWRNPWSRQGPGAGWVYPEQDWNKTKAEAPYSYSEFYIFRTGKKHDDAFYSDRMHQWDAAAWERAWKKVPRRFDQMSPSDASKWMTEYMGKPVTVTALAEGCNASSGYPYWIVWFASAEPNDLPDWGDPEDDDGE